MNCAGVHVLIKDDVPSLAEGFRLIHSRVGVAQKVLGGFIVRIRKCYTDADGCKSLISPQVEWLRQMLLYPVRDLDSFSGILDTVKQDRKLISAEPGYLVAGAQAVTQP